MGTTESKRPNSMEKDEEEKKKVIPQPEHSNKKRENKIEWGTHAHIRSTTRGQSEGSELHIGNRSANVTAILLFLFVLHSSSPHPDGGQVKSSQSHWVGSN
jgi:hypothetical protein